MLNADVPMIKEGTGPPLMLLHCLGVDHRFWDLAKPLTQDFTLYRYDLPGHGASPVPQNAYTVTDLADQLAALMEKYAITRVHISGISLGGLIAQDFAARYPSGSIDSYSSIRLLATPMRCSRCGPNAPIRRAQKALR